ncbi:hypothetical protein P171DRAFT_441872 [Karstenula rhodostoma CBS 690.94]|uniref:Uncharacterized protein n=1 Tax=Karstenula rhodostoma CBS 690.94 TaxID=1392251 RepID=A0A9P4PSE5_9PLEO|nr:hypothetical protein P171DRAFT_441872 [Karstenula rhodostoma CBS 690.94]
MSKPHSGGRRYEPDPSQCGDQPRRRDGPAVSLYMSMEDAACSPRRCASHRIASHSGCWTVETRALEKHACVSRLQRGLRWLLESEFVVLISTLATTAASPTPWPWQQIAPRYSTGPPRWRRRKGPTPNTTSSSSTPHVACAPQSLTLAQPSSADSLTLTTPSAMPYQTHIRGTTPAPIPHIFLSAPYRPAPFGFVSVPRHCFGRATLTCPPPP